MRPALIILLLLAPLGAGANPVVSSMSLTKSAAPSSGLIAGDTVHFCLDVSSPAPLADILWVIDVSNSMQVGINNIIANINAFTAMLASQGLNYRQGLFIYTGDVYIQAGVPDWYYLWYGWAPDDATFSANLTNSLSWIYGGTEWSLEALQFANTMVGWRPGASRTMILITDEGLPCVERNYIYPSIAWPSMIPDPRPAKESVTGTAAILNAGGVTVHSISKPWPWDTDPEHRCDPADLPPAAGGLWLDYNTPAPGWNAMLTQIAAAIQGKATLQVRDPVPPQVSVIPGSWCCGGALAGNQLTWTVSGYGSGQLMQFCFDGLVSTPWAWGSAITNTGYALADAIPEFPSNPQPLIYCTPTLTVTPTDSPTPTATRTDTPTPTFTKTHSPTRSATPSASPTPTFTPTPTSTATPTFTPTPSWTPTATPSQTLTSSPTPTDSPTSTISPTFTASPMPMPYHLTASVYNSAGERVRIVYIGGLSEGIGGAERLSTLIVDQSTPAVLKLKALMQNGSNLLSWDGTNDGGQNVGGGFYVMVLETKDPFDKVTLVSVGLQVVRADTTSSLGIYNSAGERVGSLAMPGKGPWTRLSSSGHSLVSGAGGLSITAEGPSGTATAYWNGTNDAGAELDSGTYYIKSDGKSGGASLALTVIRAPGKAGSALIAPNPAKGDGAWLSWPLMPGASVVQLRLYNSAGELVLNESSAASAGRIWMNSSGLAGGLYWARLSWKDGAGGAEGITLKWALAR